MERCAQWCASSASGVVRCATPRWPGIVFGGPSSTLHPALPPPRARGLPPPPQRPGVPCASARVGQESRNPTCAMGGGEPPIHPPPLPILFSVKFCFRVSVMVGGGSGSSPRPFHTGPGLCQLGPVLPTKISQCCVTPVWAAPETPWVVASTHGIPPSHGIP